MSDKGSTNSQSLTTALFPKFNYLADINCDFRATLPSPACRCLYLTTKNKIMRYLLTLFLAGCCVSFASGQLLQVKLAGSETPALGINSRTISTEKAQRLGLDYVEGAFVTRVFADSPAEDAGLRPFDYIVKIDRMEVTDRLRPRDIVKSYGPGERLKITYVRNGDTRTTNVIVGGDRTYDRTVVFVQEPVYTGLRADGQYARYGVPVRVQRNSPASRAGLRSGDIVQTVGDYRVADYDDVRLAFDQYEVGDPVAVTYLRNGDTRTDLVRLGDTEERLERIGERIEDIFDRPVVIRNGRTDSDNWERRDWNWHSSSDSHGNGAYLGVYSRTIDSEKRRKLGLNNAYGRYVSKVRADSPAEKAGLQPFDYITGLNGEAFSQSNCFSCMLNEAMPGDKVTVSYVRNGQAMTASAILADRQDFSDEPHTDNCDRPFLGVRQNHWTAPADELGVQVRIIDNTTAAGMGLTDETIIRRINGNPIVDWSDLSAAVRSTPVGSTVRLDLTTPAGKTTSMSAPMKSYRSYKGGECEERNEYSKWNRNDWNSKGDYPKVYVSGEEVTDADVEEVETVEVEQVEVADMRIKIEEIPSAEAAAMDMPTDNSLAVADLSLAPNPSMGMFNVSFNLPQRGDALIRIFNSAGREIYNYELNDFQGAFSDDVDITQNGPGLYFLAVTQNGQTMTRKLVLQRR